MRKFVLAAASLVFATSAVLADLIDDRTAIMKERGGLMGGLSKVIKGETPFDAAAVMTALEALHANAVKYDVDALYTDDSKGDPKASPKIWEDRAGFKAAAAKYEADTAAAVAAAPQDVDALKAQFGAIGANCGGCHQAYRISSN